MKKQNKNTAIIKLSENLNHIIENSNENISIMIHNLDENYTIYKKNENIQMFSASIIKVPIMLYILNEVKKRHINLSDTLLVRKNQILSDSQVFEYGENKYTLEELIYWMIISSDNTATNVLIETFGMQKINQYILNQFDIKKTELQRKMLDEIAIQNGKNNYTTQNDMLTIFSKLYHKEILNDFFCKFALNVLSQQRYKNQILRYIYQPVQFFHKTGSLDFISHDVGIMIINDCAYYIGVSVYDSNQKDGNKQLIGKIGKQIYKHLNY